MFVNTTWKTTVQDNGIWEKLYLSMWHAYPDEYKLSQAKQQFNFRLCFIRKQIAEKGVLFTPTLQGMLKAEGKTILKEIVGTTA